MEVKLSKNFLEPQEIYDYVVHKGTAKARANLTAMLSLGFLGGAFICVGYLAYIRVAGSVPSAWGGVGALLGAAIFPIGLICISLGGGELITSNMMAISTSFFARKISFKEVVFNFALITFMNLIGALFIAYFFGHVVGLTEGAFAQKTIHTAEAKINVTFVQAVVSGVGCNWLVGMGAWLCFSAKDTAGKILGIWFPIMTFVAVGFQHVVANMFVIPAAMLAGADITLLECINNLFAVFLGNLIGGVSLVAGLYTLAYKKTSNSINA